MPSQKTSSAALGNSRTSEVQSSEFNPLGCSSIPARDDIWILFALEARMALYRFGYTYCHQLIWNKLHSPRFAGVP